MSEASETQVLIAGVDPIGMTAAIELARRGIACRIVDPLVEPPQHAKAVGVQPQDARGVRGHGRAAPHPRRGHAGRSSTSTVSGSRNST